MQARSARNNTWIITPLQIEQGGHGESVRNGRIFFVGGGEAFWVNEETPRGETTLGSQVGVVV